jgi:hypothetical protein
MPIIWVCNKLSFIKANNIYLIRSTFINQLNPEIFVINPFSRLELYSPFNILELE